MFYHIYSKNPIILINKNILFILCFIHFNFDKITNRNIKYILILENDKY